ncbi:MULTISPECIES: DUF4194 domain-containing protein [unclassified Leifsonia]|mgnify:CR=1 FL=1|uniref:DUF4194 domain-containing protein n=1 Tax=unclassified Leifsonia TaxID=2663824 RepID=UPI0009295DD8|nr:DUF4194 domain-containing protein [Leifsonia sp. 71-9]OJX74989.1 MAG: hypothetical protein BGO91_07695 [Leifsonia sp. 71-9]
MTDTIADDTDLDEVEAVTADAFGDAADERLPLAARRALVTLLTSRFITRATHPEAWSGLVDYEDDVRARLEELFLTLTIDRDHEVAFKRQSAEDGAPVLLRREKPLSRDASLLLILLRQEHAYTDAADEAVTVSRDHIAEFLGRFQTDASHDEVRVDRRIRAAIAAMERIGLLVPETDDPDLYVVSPAVVPLVTTTELAHLTRLFQEASGAELRDDAAPAAAHAHVDAPEVDE